MSAEASPTTFGLEAAREDRPRLPITPARDQMTDAAAMLASERKVNLKRL
jgi:hypothetical protein